MMAGIRTNAELVAANVARVASNMGDAVKSGMTEALLAVERAAVKNLSGELGAAPYSYPVPARSGFLKNNRLVSQPSPGVGIIAFNQSYAWAVHSGVVTQWAGRGKTRVVQRPARPFADDAVKAVNPASIILDRVRGAMAI
jgi:hypothetical protein